MATNYSRGKAWSNIKPGMYANYSVWNWDTGQYDYYAPTRPIKKYGEEVKTPPSKSLGGIGEDPDVSNGILPLTSRKIGSGFYAMGEIVSMPKTPLGIATVVAIAMAVAAPLTLIWGIAKAGSR